MTENFIYGTQEPIETTTFDDNMIPTTRWENFAEMVSRSCSDAVINDPGASVLLRSVAGDDSAGSTGLTAGPEKRPVVGNASSELGSMSEDSAGDDPIPVTGGLPSLNVAGLPAFGPRMASPITSGSTTNPPGSQDLGKSAYTTIPVKIGGAHE